MALDALEWGNRSTFPLRSVTDYQRAYSEGRLTPVEAMKRLLPSARELDEKYSIFITLDEARVLDRAREVEGWGASACLANPLWGVPISVKDLVLTEGLRTTLGTAALSDHVPSCSAPIIEHLEAAGAIVFGKTNANELAYGSDGFNAHYGQTGNASDRTRIAGGSSSGAAVSVACGLVPLAIGTDTAASIRVPAAFNGIYGYRPSPGRYNNRGISPIAHTLDVVGPLGATFADIMAFDSVFAKASERSAQPREIEGLRLGVPASAYHESVAYEVLRCFESYLHELETRGAQLVHEPFDESLEAAETGLYPILFTETWEDMSNFLSEWVPTVSIEELQRGLGHDVAALWDLHVAPDAEQRFADWTYAYAKNEVREQLKTAYSDYFRRHEVDALVFPSTVSTAPPIDRAQEETIVVDGNSLSIFINDRNSGPGALAGAPGLTIPIGRSQDGLPIGASLDGIPDMDTQFLAACAKLSFSQ